MKTEARLSDDRKYRYWLTRVWDEALPMFAVIGVNPSTADETEDDPTIRKVIGFGQRLGYGGVLMLNVSAWRATDPREFSTYRHPPIGFFNQASDLRGYADMFNVNAVVAAWGKNGQRYFPGYVEAVEESFPGLMCWGYNGDGSPRHPLMLSYQTPLEFYVQTVR